MKAVIVSIIARLIAFLGVFAFVFGIVYITKNTGYLWLLFLLFTVEYVPLYENKVIRRANDDGNKSEDINDDPFGGEYGQ